MQSRADFFTQLKHRFSPGTTGLFRKFLLKLIPALAGFLLSRAGIVGDLYPFGAACAASAPRGMAASAIIGILAGYIFPGDISGRLRYIATALAVAGIKWALAEFRGINRSPLFSPAAAFAGVLLTGMVVSSSTGTALFASLVLYCAEGLLAAASSFFITSTAELLLSKGQVAPTRQQLCSAVVSASIMAIPLCQLTIYGFSPARALLMLCVLIAARLRREAGGAVAGIALGAVMAISGESFTLAGVCAAAGLICSLFMPAGV